MRKQSSRTVSKNNIFASGIFSLLLIIICSCYFGSFFSSAHNTNLTSEEPREKYYKSIEIQKGDSIWKIASDNICKEYQSIYEYIDEILSINNINILAADSIQEGDYITIAYYQ